MCSQRFPSNHPYIAFKQWGKNFIDFGGVHLSAGGAIKMLYVLNVEINMYQLICTSQEQNWSFNFGQRRKIFIVNANGPHNMGYWKFSVSFKMTIRGHVGSMEYHKMSTWLKPYFFSEVTSLTCHHMKGGRRKGNPGGRRNHPDKGLHLPRGWHGHWTMIMVDGLLIYWYIDILIYKGLHLPIGWLIKRQVMYWYLDQEVEGRCKKSRNLFLAKKTFSWITFEENIATGETSPASLLWLF